MRILALEPYYGGSHKAFLDGWIQNSSCEWTVLKLPAYKWKWRMRHAAVSFSQQVNQLAAQGKQWDVIFCCDMLNLAEFLGLADEKFKKLPSVVYFHENQLTYPVQFESERDYQFAMTNFTTAITAGQVWFNSDFHRASFLSGLKDFLKKMPDFQPLDEIERIERKSSVHYPGIKAVAPRGQRAAGPIRILWAGRWEHDKNPEDFFEAMKRIKSEDVDFRLSVIGQSFRQRPDVFQWAKKFFKEHIDHWGYQEKNSDYQAALLEADVVVSTANHEFFGIGIVEAVAAGAWPMLPKRLSYPEILDLKGTPANECFFYDGSVKELSQRLLQLAERIGRGSLWEKEPRKAVQAVERFFWSDRAASLDEAIKKAVQL